MQMKESFKSIKMDVDEDDEEESDEEELTEEEKKIREVCHERGRGVQGRKDMSHSMWLGVWGCRSE